MPKNDGVSRTNPIVPQSLSPRAKPSAKGDGREPCSELDEALRKHAQPPNAGSPVPVEEEEPEPEPKGVSGVSGVSGVFQGDRGVIDKTALFLADYAVLPPSSHLILSAWTAAAWMVE